MERAAVHSQPEPVILQRATLSKSAPEQAPADTNQ
jgi:hypothetical protein